MTHDWYSKAVLTVIAGALVMLVVQNLAPNARAGVDCGGDHWQPCHVKIDGEVSMRIVNR